MIKLDKICLGHITKLQNKECIICKNDKLNEQCKDYKPIEITYFKIEREVYKN